MWCRRVCNGWRGPHPAATPGDPAKQWVDDFKERFAPEPLGHGLVLNCGNGWVERELVDKGIVRTVTAFDYSWDLLCTAIGERGAWAIHSTGRTPASPAYPVSGCVFAPGSLGVGGWSRDLCLAPSPASPGRGHRW